MLADERLRRPSALPLVGSHAGPTYHRGMQAAAALPTAACSSNLCKRALRVRVVGPANEPEVRGSVVRVVRCCSSRTDVRLVVGRRQRAEQHTSVSSARASNAAVVSMSVNLVLLQALPSVVQPRSQRSARRQQGAPVDAAQEAWMERLSTFDATSGERMWEANSALQQGDLREEASRVPPSRHARSARLAGSATHRRDRRRRAGIACCNDATRYEICWAKRS